MLIYYVKKFLLLSALTVKKPLSGRTKAGADPNKLEVNG